MVADLELLYRTLGERLERMVRRDVRAPTVVIEDACQFAWTRLAVHAKGIEPETALAWLAKTAVRHAVKLIRRDQRELSLEAYLDEAGELGLAAVAPDAAQYAEWHEQLESVRRLPRRQQTLLWMRAAGLGYTEIAIATGLTARTVERQLYRGRSRLRGVA